MPRAELAEAAEILERAAADADGEAAEALRSQAEQLNALAERDRGPDHGRLDRHQQALRDVKADVDDAVANRIDEANDLIVTYRETLPGV
jgi:hypothetical protein